MDIKHECKTSLGKKKKKSFYEYGCSMKEDIDENSKDRFEDMQLFEDFGSGQRKNIIYISDAKMDSENITSVEFILLPLPPCISPN